MSDKNKIKNSRIPNMKVGEMVNLLSDAYSEIIKKDLPVRTMPSVMLWGPPGVGKSQAVKQIGKELEKSTGKKVNTTDVRLLLFNPIDLRGIPTSNADKTLSIWLKPQIFQMDDSDDVINILFLDEISAAPQSVQAAAYQITLDRVVGEHKLPENCIVIAAGNRVTDKSVAFKMPKALANRLMHIEVEGNIESWKEWAIKNGISDKVIGFLSFKQDRLMVFDSSTDDLAFPTPRSWEMVSNVLNSVGGDAKDLFPLISGLVGSGTAIEFRTWLEVYKDLPSIKDIFNGKNPAVPENTDAMFALISSMTAYARNHMDDVNGIANSIKYTSQMPPDFAAVLMKDYRYLDDDFLFTLMTIPEYSKWVETKGRLMNGQM